jgi:alpha-1,2-glucosyltransferase
MLFFSFPIIAQSFIQGNIPVCKTLPQLARTVFVLGTMINLAMMVIHYNTIVHPFTLADNRHYVFYVFKILLRHPAIKYLVAPAYILSGYAVIQALGGKPQQIDKPEKGAKLVTISSGCRTSFILVWLVTTILSLITAPLVEPRYCILPWMMWRMHVPIWSSTGGDAENKDMKNRQTVTIWNSIYGPIMEMVWFLAIAVATGYMFLYQGFAWPQEPSKVQRFMW